ncbi:ATP12 family chaperone protein [Pseudooceanicola sp. C21-150M6]|uniref:ATP12 family chaperone protein n=1 Tax=Pseudooceanicola sp. C21-150M6 TaxID=3434355 RepID=UPI003D7F2CA8
MSEWAPKRFWKVTEVVTSGDGYGVTLDGRAVRTPAKALLVLPSRAMAEAVAAEWEAQAEVVDPRSMPATRGANAAIDKVAVQFDEVAEMLIAYGDSDLLCYRADSPEELVARQAAAWDPLLDWAAATYGARLEPRTGIMHEAQSEAALAKLGAEVHRMTAFELAAFHDLVSLSGSLVIGLAAAQGAWPAEELWDLSRIDESWQEEQWGVDEDAAQTAAIKRESFLNAKRFFDASQSSDAI